VFRHRAPGSTRDNRRQIKESGFSTKAAAERAEAERRLFEDKKYELEKAGLPEVPIPTTLADLLDDFFAEHAERELARKTIERYREQAAYLHPYLLAMPVCQIRPLDLSKDWDRLLQAGGRFRNSGLPRPLAPKTVRNIAGVLSSAFARAIKWREKTIAFAHSIMPSRRTRYSFPSSRTVNTVPRPGRGGGLQPSGGAPQYHS
jgi:hypothetical protein